MFRQHFVSLAALLGTLAITAAALSGCSGSGGVTSSPTASLKLTPGASSSFVSGKSAVSSKATSSAESVSPQATDSAVSEISPAKGEKFAYLTFDDGPTKYTPQVLQILRQYNVKGTFFIAFMGEDSQQKRDWIKQEVDEGNGIGIHSWTHDYPYMYANETNFLADFNRMRQIIRDTTGVDPKICRLPGGLGNTVSIRYSGHVIMPTLVKDVENMGITPFDWNAGGQDAEKPYPSGSQFAREILNECAGQNDVLILMHDTHSWSVEALPTVIQSLKAQGYTFKIVTPGVKTYQEHFVGVSYSSKSTPVQGKASSKKK